MYICFGRVSKFYSTSVCEFSVTVARHIRFLLVSSFSQVCLLEWGFAFQF